MRWGATKNISDRMLPFSLRLTWRSQNALLPNVLQVRLKAIHLSGFKSFVEPTEILLSRSVTAIVGPNGCGKSNIVDGVRWGIGESSARYLRGEEIADVIFRGTDSRHHVSRASIELIFDNEDQRLGGEYANFSEISIRRDVTSDAPSSYFLNNRRCRRRDVRDIFRGTGFGSRSYSIIEQGLIGELAEASPMEMRGHIEEAAGISIYRDRRRESENKMVSVSANLDQLRVQQAELQTQVNRLSRQTREADRYRKLVAQERETSAIVLLLEIQNQEAGLAAHDGRNADLAHQREELDSKLRATERELALAMAEREKKDDELKVIQAQEYEVRERMATLRQGIATRKDHLADLDRQASELATNMATSIQQEVADSRQSTELKKEIERVERERSVAHQDVGARNHYLKQVRDEQRSRQEEWDSLQEHYSQNAREIHADKMAIAEADRLIQEARQVLQSRLKDAEESAADNREEGLRCRIAEDEKKASELETAVAEAKARLEETRAGLAVAEREVDEFRAQVLKTGERRTALKAVQEAQFGQDHNEELHAWLDSCGLSDAPELGGRLRVIPGWELAVEVSLGEIIRARLAEDLQGAAQAASQLPCGSISLYQEMTDNQATGRADSLATVAIQSDDPAKGMLEHVLAADSLASAIEARNTLTPGQFFVTKQGEVVGRNWARLERLDKSALGIIERGRQIERIERQWSQERKALADAENTRDSINEQVANLVRERDEFRRLQQAALASMSSFRTEANMLAEVQDAALARREQAKAEIQQANSRIRSAKETINAAQERLKSLRARRAELTLLREKLTEQREVDQAHLGSAQEALDGAREKLHGWDIELQGLRTRETETRSALGRVQKSKANIQKLQEHLEASRRESSTPIQGMEAELALASERIVSIEAQHKQLASERDQIDERLTRIHEQRAAHETGIEEVRNRVQDELIARERLASDLRYSQEKFDKTGMSRAAAEGLAADAGTHEELKQQIHDIEQRIARMPEINLASSVELERVKERKHSLDDQIADLESALETLHEAIRKIDLETTTQFKATLDKVNAHLDEVFQQIFEGGSAKLELNGSNLLDAGVELVAQPPGKSRISTQMLSGGEKALSALALVFAIFKLNPSPVCVLDEVDAPLDDTNVGRFVTLVEELSREIQFLIVTHNRVTMERADALLGVTMQEAGVSRLVSVDLEKAIAMASD